MKLIRSITVLVLLVTLHYFDDAYADLPPNHVPVPIIVDDLVVIVPVPVQWSAPVGRANPGPICAQSNKPKFTAFACSFMTKTLWEGAGRPRLDSEGNIVPKHIPGWEPIFYEGTAYPENYGLLEKMRYTAGPSTVERYTPWSVRATQGTNAQVFMPWDNGGALERYALLAFDFDGYGSDTTPGPAYPYDTFKDPTITFEEGAFASIVLLIGYHQEHRSGNPNALHDLLVSGTNGGSGISRGFANGAAFVPDYGKDGTVLLVMPDQSSFEMNNLAAAAEFASAYGLMFANGSLNSFEEA